MRNFRIVRNACRCKLCDDVLESRHVHHFVQCKCGACFTDGGLEYVRRGARDLAQVEDMTEYAEDER